MEEEEGALAKLTEGGCLSLKNGKKINMPVFQFLGYKEYTKKGDDSIAALKRRRAVLSDGQNTFQVIFATIYDSRQTNPSLLKCSLYRLLDYDNSKVVGGRRLVIIYEAETVSVGKSIYHKLGGQLKSIDEEVGLSHEEGQRSEDVAYMLAVHKLCVELEVKYQQEHPEGINCCIHCDRKMLDDRYELTPNGISMLMNSSGELSTSAILQVLESFHCVETNRFWLVVSDGQECCVANVHESLIICAREEIPKKSLIQVLNHVIKQQSSDRYSLILLDFNIIITGDNLTKIIGDPEMVKSSMPLPEISSKPRQLKLKYVYRELITCCGSHRSQCSLYYANTDLRVASHADMEDSPCGPPADLQLKYDLHKHFGTKSSEPMELFLEMARKTVSKGYIERIFRGEEDIHNPILQVGETMIVPGQRTCHLLLSDGVQLTIGTLCPRLNDAYLRTGRLKSMALMEVLRYTCNNNPLENSKTIVVHKIGKIIPGLTPVDFDALPGYSDKLPTIDEKDARGSLMSSLQKDAKEKYGCHGDTHEEPFLKTLEQKCKNEILQNPRDGLSAGAVEKLLQGLPVIDSVLQVLVLKKVLIGHRKQYGAILSDGFDVIPVFFSSSLSSLCESGDIQEIGFIEIRQLNYTIHGEDGSTIEIQKVGFTVKAEIVKSVVGKPTYNKNKMQDFQSAQTIVLKGGIRDGKSGKTLITARQSLGNRRETSMLYKFRISTKPTGHSNQKGGLKVDISHNVEKNLFNWKPSVGVESLVRIPFKSETKEADIARYPPISGFSRFADKWHQKIELLETKKKKQGWYDLEELL